MDNYNRLIKFYTYFFQRIYSYRDFEYDPNQRDIKILQKFAKRLDENVSLGDQWLFEYFAFQFKYWAEKKYKRFNAVVISYIIGEKAIERFESNKNEHLSYFISEFIRKYQLNIDDLTQNKYYKRDLLNISKNEENEKLRIGDSYERILNCVENTTLFNIRSQVCVFCSKSKICKEIQQKKYPEVYRLRNEKNIEKRAGIKA